MPAKLPKIDAVTANKLILLGQQIKAHRKQQKISAIATSEAAGLSRVTLYRIEKGESSVAMAAYLQVIAVLGMEFTLTLSAAPPLEERQNEKKGWIPARIQVADYPQLKQLAWQLHTKTELTLTETLSLYERNWRHLDLQQINSQERDLIDALCIAFRKGEPLV